MAFKDQTCDRCGIHKDDTEEGFLAYNGTRYVCSSCNSDIDNEECGDYNHPINALMY